MDTKHFSSKEFMCKCPCNSYTPNLALTIVLEHVRERFDKPVAINSATRCKAHNKSEGGADNSLHLTGHAADIVVKGIKPSEVYEYLDSSGYSMLIGLHAYDTFTHIDVRGHKARW